MSGLEKIINNYVNEHYLLPKKFGDYLFFYFNEDMVIVYNYRTKDVLRSTTFVSNLVNIFGIDEELINQFLSNWCNNKFERFPNLEQIQSLF